MDGIKEKYITCGQACKIAGVSNRTMSKWFDQNKIEGFRIPGQKHRRISKESLLRFLVEHNMPTDGFAKHEYENERKVLAVTTDQVIIAKLRTQFIVIEARDLFMAGVKMRDEPSVVLLDTAFGVQTVSEVAARVSILDSPPTTVALLADDVSPNDVVGFHFFAFRNAVDAVVKEAMDYMGGEA